MSSTPDDPVDPSEPTGAPAPQPADPPVNPYANPYAAAPGQPQPGWQQPGQSQPYPGQGQPYPSQGQPYPGSHPAPGWQQHPGFPARKGLSFGARLGLGVAIGVVAHVVCLVLLFAIAAQFGLFAGLTPFILLAVASVVGMFFRVTRPWATGVLIIAAAAWLIVLGPCIALIYSIG
ncbi:hypothetical protein Q9R19_11630 [Microbacterium sp. ARD32]|uniref:hypothetical protein n=1 Tax=Microbacterium sp. ARD32 TaxID=2962577 RepID=UPI0028829D77|nr:hypothetical protein [Microbacterium sp. ARD32]MDT0158278.1 hypothetical protein [Microbacterium sp. ARD32]